MDITSTNATIYLTVPTLKFNNLRIEKFSVESMADMSEIPLAEKKIGVDGQSAFGVIPAFKTVVLNLEADSPSISSINTIYLQQAASSVPYQLFMLILMPSINRSLSFDFGVMTSYTFSSLAKTLTPASVTFDFEKLVVADIIS